MSDRVVAYFGAGIALGASTDNDAVPVLRVDREDRYLAVQVIIDNAANNGAPTDTPMGTIELWSRSAKEVEWSLVDEKCVTDELARVAAVGNTRISKWAVFEGVPGEAVFRYNRTSGGGASTTTSRLRLYLST